MSKTIRRKHLNKKKHFLTYYWTSFSDKDLWFISNWKYHSDNYYNKKNKNVKQFFAKQVQKEFRQDFNSNIKKHLISSNIDDFFDVDFKVVKPKNIKWMIT